MITPNQFNLLATKEDVKKIVREELTDVKGDVAKILTSLDTMNKTLSSREVEDVAHTASHRRIQTAIENHEERIINLEPKTVAV